MKKIVLITGGFDPLHSGHIEYFIAAKSISDMLIVVLKRISKENDTNFYWI